MIFPISFSENDLLSAVAMLVLLQVLALLALGLLAALHPLVAAQAASLGRHAGRVIGFLGALIRRAPRPPRR